MIQNGFVRGEEFTRGHIQELIDIPIKKWRTKDTRVPHNWKSMEMPSIQKHNLQIYDF